MERFEEFTSFGRKFIKYEYFAMDGRMFSCTSINLFIARLKRDKWLSG